MLGIVGLGKLCIAHRSTWPTRYFIVIFPVSLKDSFALGKMLVEGRMLYALVS